MRNWAHLRPTRIFYSSVSDCESTAFCMYQRRNKATATAAAKRASPQTTSASLS